MNITFKNEKSIIGTHDKTVLELALEQGIPLLHACKGNARCSTCRVLILKGNPPPRTPKEQVLAEKLGLPDNVRLSCQVKATEDMTVRRLIMDDMDRKNMNQANSAEEKNLAILFSDIRSFTTFSERNLPHDIVHILNRYFFEMGTAIHNHKGTIDKYMGDGIMAIFGLEGEEHPAELAYQSALEMLERLKTFNDYLSKTYGESFQIGIGIHYGPVVVGQLGHPKQSSFTAIGDTVNVAARIESATKGRGNILVSKAVYEAIEASNWESTELMLKGKTHSLSLYIAPV